MVTLFAPYQFSVPETPQDLKMETMKEFFAFQEPEEAAQEAEAEPSAAEKDEPPVRKLQFV